MAHSTMEADKMLDIYIEDYFLKKKYSNSAKTFQAEAQLPKKSTAIDIPGSFLYEWWSVFWEVFIARYKRTGVDNEALITKAKEQHQLQQQQQHQLQQQQQHQHQQQQHQHQHQQQQRQLNSEQQWLQQVQLQLFLQQQEQHLQRQCHGDETRLQLGNTRNNLAKQSAAAQKMYEEGLNLQSQKNVLSEAEIKKFMQPKYSENAGQLFDATHASILRSAVSGDQTPELLIHNLPVDNLKCLSGRTDRKQQPLASEDLKNSMTPPMNPRAAHTDGSLHGVTGSNLAVNTSPLKGWPLMGLDRLQTGLSHQRKSFPHPYRTSQLQLDQQIRTILTRQNIDMENIGMDGQWNFVGNNIPNMLPVQVGHPILSHGDSWMQLQKSNLSQQQPMQPLPLGPMPEKLDQQPPLLDRIGAAGSTARDIPISNISIDYDQASKDRPLKKRKQPMSSGGPANSSGAANTTAATLSSAPSTPSTHTAEDVISVPALPPEDNSSKADLDKFAKNGSMEDDVDSFLSHDNPETASMTIGLLDTNQDITFSEIVTIHANRANCCDLSLDGKLIATGGDDKKAVLWCTESRKQKYAFEHSGSITDLCFGPRLPRLATSSLDKTVKIWNVDEPGCLLRTFVGHSASVMSVDFHPKKEDLVCSCDDVSSIRYWSIKNGGCTGMLTGCATLVRFEPTCGRYLAAAVGNGVSIIDVETTQTYRYPLKGHATDVLSVCWDSTGEYLASMSEDSVRVWKIGSWGLEDCIHELSITDKKFSCFAFHPCRSSLLIIGSNESLELWHMAENKMMSALGQPMNSLAVSKAAGLVASVSDGNLIKLWK